MSDLEQDKAILAGAPKGKKIFNCFGYFDFSNSFNSERSLADIQTIVTLREQLAQAQEQLKLEQECYEKNAADSLDLLAECSDENETLREQLAKAQEQLATAKADGIREAIIVYKKKHPLKYANCYVFHAFEHMKNYTYKLTSNTIDKGE